jgi:hypothetical protein
MLDTIGAIQPSSPRDAEIIARVLTTIASDPIEPARTFPAVT